MNAYIHTMTATDENGEKAILYPRTKQEAVEGLAERLAKLEVADIEETEDTTLENSHAGRLMIEEMRGGGISQNGTPTFDLPKEINRTSISAINITDESGNIKTVVFSQPFELIDGALYKNGLISGIYKKIVFNGNENWQASSFSKRYYVDGLKCKAFGVVYCTHAKGLTQEATNTDECYLSGSSNGFFVINTTFATVTAFKEWLASNPMTVIYELAEETAEELPIENQISLNSIPTYDGITYVEFVSDVQPTFYKLKYGTTEMGGMTLESLLTARNNDLRLSAVESAVINNI